MSTLSSDGTAPVQTDVAPTAPAPQASVAVPVAPAASVPAQPPTARPITSEDVQVVFNRLLAEKAKNDPVRLSRMLVKQNLELAAQAKDAEFASQAAQAKLAESMPSDHVPVPKSDAELLAVYKALGTVDQIKANVTQLQELNTTVQAEAIRRIQTGVAEFAEWDLPVVERLAKADNLEFRESTVPGKDGIPEKTYLVKGPFGDRGGDKEITLQDLINGPWRPFRESLLAGFLAKQGGPQPRRPSAPSFDPRMPMNPGDPNQTPPGGQVNPMLTQDARFVTRAAPFIGKGATPMRTPDSWSNVSRDNSQNAVEQTNRNVAGLMTGGI